MATLTTVHNPFDPINSREIKEVQVGKPIYSVIDGFYCHFDVVVSLNGQITHDYEYVIQEEDHIGFVAVPSKGGGKNILGMVAMVALAVAAPYAAGAVMGATAGMVGAGVYGGLSGALIFGGLQMGVMMAGGMLINSLMAPDMPSSTPTTSIASSPTYYGWDNVQNQSTEGIALPIAYGKTKIVPPIISQYVETKDNKQYLNILYALNNGEITLVSDITINNNPITYFNDVTYEVRNGTNTQTLIPSFDNTRVDQSVGAKLSTTETIRRTSYNNVRGLTIIVSAPSGMYYANDGGGLDSRSVTLVVKYKKVGDATWTTIANTSISGVTTSTIRQTFQADNIPAGEYDISITRTTAESTSTRTSDKVYFEGFTEIIYNDFTYPNTALLAIRALATDQLSGSMPSVSCVVDRGFGTSNPATAARNIIELVGADVITTAFDEWATWCTGQNFTCNMVFDSEVNVRDALNIVGTLGRANVIQIGSEYMPIIDRVETMPVQRFLFTMGNIIRDSFKEEYLPLADRSNVVEVTYFDETLDYEKQSVEISQYGFDESSDTVRKASVTLYGCTNRTQAVRHGRFLMNKNRYLTNTVSFEADVDAIACTIGDVINVSHDVPQWGYSGRVIDAGMAHKINKLSYSERVWDNSVWLVGSTLANFYTVTESNDYINPNTGSNVAKFVARAGTTELFLRKNNLALVSGNTYTASIWLYIPAQSGINSYQIVNDYSDANPAYSIVQSVFNKWVRVDTTVAITANRTLADFAIKPNLITPVQGFTFYACSPQLELGALSDYEPTNTQWCYTQQTYVDGTIATTANTNVVQLDREVTLNASTVYQLVIRQHDDTIVTVSITTNALTITDVVPIPLSVTLEDYDVFAFGETNRVTKLFRVISITRSSDQRRKISAIEYIPEVYNDELDNLGLISASSLTDVSYLNIITDTEISTDGRTINIINLVWGGSAISWDVYQREAYTTTWTLIGNTQNSYFQIKDVMNGSYEFKVGDKIVSQSVTSISYPLADVTNMVSYYQNGNMIITWNQVIERYRSPILYEVRRGVAWNNSEVLGRSNTNQILADTAGTYWVKAYYLGSDGQESYSTNETGLSITGETVLKNVVATWDEYATGWTGTKTNVTVDAGNLKMAAGTPSGTYDIPVGHIITLASPQLCRVSMSYSAGAGTSALFDSIADIDTYANIDGDATGTWSVKPKLAISQDGTTYGAWQDYAIGDYVGKSFKARLEITCNKSEITVIVDGFNFTVDMPDRLDKRTLTTATGGTAVTFTTPFQVKPNTQITIVNATAGDDVKLTAETSGGFTVQVLNGGSGVARTINYLSQGY
ncbi:MAG: host specificity factor TipJ family phage tail protein [Sulfuricurvum sp.]